MSDWDEQAKIVALEAIAQGWCEPETSSQEMDVVLAEAIAKPVGKLVANWMATAAMHARNEAYYRSLIDEIGKMLGPEAYISDDGSVQEDVLCAKVPELVRELTALRTGAADSSGTSP